MKNEKRDFTVLGEIAGLTVARMETGRLSPRFRSTDYLLIDRGLTAKVGDELVIAGRVAECTQAGQRNDGIIVGFGGSNPLEVAHG